VEFLEAGPLPSLITIQKWRPKIESRWWICDRWLVRSCRVFFGLVVSQNSFSPSIFLPLSLSRLQFDAFNEQKAATAQPFEFSAGQLQIHLQLECSDKNKKTANIAELQSSTDRSVPEPR